MNRAAIIILNWNRSAKTVECVKSILGRDPAARKSTIIVVDNGSKEDPSVIVEQLQMVTLLRNSRNLGYAGGNNIGIRYALDQGFEYICVLNNDLVSNAAFLHNLLSVLESDNEVGAVTPLIAKHPEGNSVWSLGQTLMGTTGKVDRLYADQPLASVKCRGPIEVDAISGAAFAARREVFEQVGLFDEEYFLYFEEVDWSFRIKRAGYRIKAIPTAVVWHEVSGTLGAASPIIDYYMLRNHLRLLGKHVRPPRRYYLLTRVILRNFGHIAAFSIKSRNGNRIPHRNARVLALRDAVLGRWGEMGENVARVCRTRPL